MAYNRTSNQLGTQVPIFMAIHFLHIVQVILYNYSMLDNIFKPTLDWIRDDYTSDKLRFCLESLAWAISIGCSITMATTVPNPPLLTLYPIWITGCAVYAWCAFSRRSFGMLANYVLLTTIDTIGLIRMIVE